MELSTMSPKEVRALIRDGVITHQTSGMCGGYAQANLCILPKDYAFDFLLFCMFAASQILVGNTYVRDFNIALTP